MRKRWPAAAMTMLALVGAGRVCAQETPGGAATGPAAPAPAVTPESDEAAWLFSASVYGYSVADTSAYLQPTLTADRGRLHLEGRYNYEDIDTVSLWIGYNLGGGEKLIWELTPMIGGVAGDTRGVAPGYRMSLAYGRLAFSTEGEYVVDARGSSESFFYSWSELSAWPVDWLGFGVAFQRTRLRESDAWVEPGVLVGVAYREASLTVYAFDSEESRPTVVVGVGVSFGSHP